MSKKTIALKNKIDLVSVGDSENHIVITLSLAANHQPADANALDLLLQNLTSHARLYNYKLFVKEPKAKGKKNKFKTDNFV